MLKEAKGVPERNMLDDEPRWSIQERLRGTGARREGNREERGAGAEPETGGAATRSPTCVAGMVDHDSTHGLRETFRVGEAPSCIRPTPLHALHVGSGR